MDFEGAANCIDFKFSNEFRDYFATKGTEVKMIEGVFPIDTQFNVGEDV